MSITAGLSLLVYTLVDANSAGWASTQTLGLGAIALALIAGFYLIERRQKAPLVPFPGIFRIRTITGINVSAVLIAAALFSMFFFISLYMQNVLGYSALEAGIAYLPLAVGIIVTAGASRPTGDPLRLQAGAGLRPAHHRRRPALVLAGRRGRQLRRRHPVPVAARGDRPRAWRSCR